MKITMVNHPVMRIPTAAILISVLRGPQRFALNGV